MPNSNTCTHLSQEEHTSTSITNSTVVQTGNGNANYSTNICQQEAASSECSVILARKSVRKSEQKICALNNEKYEYTLITLILSVFHLHCAYLELCFGAGLWNKMQLSTGKLGLNCDGLAVFIVVRLGSGDILCTEAEGETKLEHVPLPKQLHTEILAPRLISALRHWSAPSSSSSMQSLYSSFSFTLHSTCWPEITQVASETEIKMNDSHVFMLHVPTSIFCVCVSCRCTVFSLGHHSEMEEGLKVGFRGQKTPVNNLETKFFVWR